MKNRESGEAENGFFQGRRTAESTVGEASETVADNNPLAANRPRLTTDDALAYLKAVKDKFKNDKTKYEEFLEVIKDFKAQKLDTAGVISRVKQLFKGYPKLIMGFNAFLPRGYEITQPEEEKPAVEFDQAINYVNKIKARFATEEIVYKQFLEILNYYRKGNKTINEVYQEVANLFADHSDLLEEFTCFLPGTSGTCMGNDRRSFKRAQPNVRQADEKGIGESGMSSIDRLRIRDETSSYVQGELSRERPSEHRAAKPWKAGEKSDWKGTGHRKDRVDREEGGRDKQNEFAEQKPAKRTSARNASDAIRRQSQAREGGEGFSGPVPQASTDDKKAVKSAVGVHHPFFDKVKARLCSRDTYQEFLKCLNIFSQEIIGREELQSLVGDILGKHADLMEGFTEFLTHCENVEGCIAGVFTGLKLGDFAETAPLKVVKIERDGERERNRERERDAKEKEHDVKPSLAAREGAHKVVPNKDKHINKPISELDLSNCDRCTPSYRLLPKHYTRPVSNHRTALENSVLNDSWVSVTSGSEDYSFKHMRKNPYEESLFRCEDDRFELDMLLEGTAMTAKLVGEYTTKQEEQSGEANELPPVHEFFSAMSLRCIERIYGDHGLDMLEAVRKNTSRAMPLIHSRLVQKEEEWTRCREEMNKVWSEVYTKNCYKALDHRSFYFRSQDKKALSTKVLLGEIKEVNEKGRREGDAMLAIAAGNRRPLLPDLRYEFSDLSIHGDMYQIIKYSSEEISNSPDHTEKTMQMWRMFLDPMLGLWSRSEGVEDMEKGVKGRSSEGNGGDETSILERRTTPHEGGGIVCGDVEVVGVEGCGARVTAGTTNGEARQADGNGERNSEDSAGGGAGERGGDGAGEGAVRATVEDDGEGTAARMGGCGWLHTGIVQEKQSSGAAERDDVKKRENAGHDENRGRRSVANGGGFVDDGKDRGGRGTPDEEEGEVSPVSEREKREQSKCSPRRGRGENGVVKLFDYEEVAEGAGGAEMEHEQDAYDEGEESAQKSSEDSDTPSEGGEEVLPSEESGDDQADHDDDEEDAEGKVESEGEAEGMTDVEGGDGNGNSPLANSEQSYAHCKPLAAHPGPGAGLTVVSHSKKGGGIFYGNDTLYVLLRLGSTKFCMRGFCQRR
ncbi:paired amphipathic helix protein Sin3-like 3 isoform X2 [Physcomitrium patens]|uniref:Histone deacetylase interacting domain-containing protein n=1 Tax=Physcomitrium patens TaxID=3218 RepID=A0A2K1K7Y3_PHYPA|nr:paired amphipathic helix protein Sin3-like 2 isoform X2 [Physcomitrium patens]PNR49887.1 hypothetical protein PHYPA_011784 [Physcomitrium patens]|eukprot:XP_024381894.1 paired amphipathic helix protein Sin3-like 2 isoform X2 [Physcomitrella patens]